MSPGSCSQLLFLLNISAHSHPVVLKAMPYCIDAVFADPWPAVRGFKVQSMGLCCADSHCSQPFWGEMSPWLGWVRARLTSETDCSHRSVAYVTTHLTVQCECAMPTCGRSLLRKLNKLCSALSCRDRNTQDNSPWNDLVLGTFHISLLHSISLHCISFR